ncbi:MAG: FG-GAP-like repeat-containing protein [Bryobacteraceae bacterium]|nr:FG-GAP-like repeat-containing protein [Bryobacteraceae bacterium]
MIHARAELLYYNPNLAFELGARVARLQPSAGEYLLNLTEWLSGEVRFTHETEHRVPHDPLLGLDRSLQLLERVMEIAMPYSSEEAMSYFAMARALSKRGEYQKSLEFFELAMARPLNQGQRPEILREFGVSYYRLGRFDEAARQFYRAFQMRGNPIDQWLLKVAVDMVKDDSLALPDEFRFPLAAARVDPSNPPLLAFENVAARLGVNRFDGNGTCAWGDIDGDGGQDLVLAGSGTFLAAYRREGDKFREVTREVGLERVPSSYSLNLVDYDNDGKLDLYLAYNGWNGPMKNRLLRNDGGRFVDVSEKTKADDGGDGFVSVWGDLNNDGLLDLVIANGVLKDGSTPQVYANRGGVFENVTVAAGIKEPATYGAIGAALGDYDRDGDLDIFFNGLVNSPNRLYRNDGGFKFTDVTKASGLASQPFHNGFVAFFTDYNNDLYPDLLVTALAPWDVTVAGLRRDYAVPSKQNVHADATRLFRNNKDGTFTDVTWEAGLYRPMGTMGAGVADLDNDGFIDFYYGTGDPQLSRIEPNRFFRNNGDGTFSDLTDFVKFQRPGNKGHGVCFIDYDDDGDLDLYAQLGGHYPGDWAENAFYRNLKGNQNRWFQIELAGVKSNRFGIGAQVTLKAGPLTLLREVKGSEGFGATSPYRQTFGLGKNDAIEWLEILWPSGLKQRLTGLKTNQLISVREGDAQFQKLR